MLVDANILLYAVDELSPFHERAREWLEGQLRGVSRVGLAWQTLAGFVRIVTHPRALPTPLSGDEAVRQVESWLAARPVWVPLPMSAHLEVFGSLVRAHGVTGDLVPDARLAALAIEHGLVICSADTDFARFRAVEWFNPLA